MAPRLLYRGRVSILLCCKIDKFVSNVTSLFITWMVVPVDPSRTLDDRREKLYNPSRIIPRVWMKMDQRLEFLLEPLEIYIQRATRDFYSNEKLNRPSPSCIKSIVPPYRFSSPFSPSIFSSPTFSPIFLSHFLPRRNIYPTFYTSNGLKTHGGGIRQVSVHTHLIQKNLYPIASQIVDRKNPSIPNLSYNLRNSRKRGKGGKIRFGFIW